jgi:hypothetical protein
MRAKVSRKLAFLGLTLALAAAGCARPPSFTPAEGTLLLDDQPLPNAKIELYPDGSRYGVDYNAVAITDDQGHFTFHGAYKDQDGAPVGKDRVVVTEAPPPRNLRGQSAEAQEAYTKYMQDLKNRPIPGVYASAVKTPLIVEIKSDQKEYTIHLTRKGP